MRGIHAAFEGRLWREAELRATKRLPLTYEVAPEHFNHLMKRAILFAEGKGSKEDKHEHLQELIQICKGTPLPYDKQKRDSNSNFGCFLSTYCGHFP